MFSIIIIKRRHHKPEQNSECWLVVRKLHSWGHLCGVTSVEMDKKKKNPFIIINYYYWSKFAEE